MPAEHIDHGAVRSWLAKLETKAAGSMTFPAYGGGGYASGISPPGQGSWFAQYLPGATRDYAAEAGDLWRNSAVAACLGWITDNFSEPCLEVVRTKRNGQEEAEPNHPFVQLMREPNPDYDADALWAATVLSMSVSGDSYWIKCKAPTGRTMQVYWVPHWEIEPKWAPTGKSFIDYYEHIVDGKRIPLRCEDVVHFRRGLNPVNVRRGLPQLEPVLREVVTDNAIQTYSAGICKNWGIPGVVMFPESDNVVIEDDEAASVKRTWSEGTTGDNVGKPLVMSVKMRIQELTNSPQEMALDKIGEIPEARICAAMRLPPMVVGLSVGDKQKTYANMAVAERMAYRNCLIPMQKNFAKTLTRQLLPDVGGQPKERARWNYTSVEAMSEEADSVAKRTVLLFTGGLISQEEGREKVGYGPKKEGDTFVPPKFSGIPKTNPDADPVT